MYISKGAGRGRLLQLARSVFPPRCGVPCDLLRKRLCSTRYLSHLYPSLFFFLSSAYPRRIWREAAALSPAAEALHFYGPRGSRVGGIELKALDDLRTRVRPFCCPSFCCFFFNVFCTRDIFYRYILMRRLYSAPRSSDVYPTRESRSQTGSFRVHERSPFLSHIRAIYILHPNTVVVCLWSAGIMRSRRTQRRVSYAAVERALAIA